MAAAAAVNRPPSARQGPNVGNPCSHANTAVPNPGQQDPGLNGTSQDPGPPSSHSQHHISARPVFYVPAPPPPAFLQYQWPMPLSYNPFAGFPGMGYGIAMPPLPPPPYMEAPAYILPHPHIQPVDYRRLLHPQVHAPNVPYQNPNQTRRIRPPHTVPVREMVNSAVQTEPAQSIGGYADGSPHVRSDSGHGTASISSSSSCSSQKRGSAELENYTLPSCNANDIQVNSTSTSGIVKHDFSPHSTGTKAVQSCVRENVAPRKCHKDCVGQENVPQYRQGHCNMWSVGSTDSIVTMCSSSQQEDEIVKERRISVPDILMSWGGGTPQAMTLTMADKVMHQDDQQLPSYESEVEPEKSLYHSAPEPRNGPVMADSADANNDADQILSSKDGETLYRILKLPFALDDLLSGARKEIGPLESLKSVRQCLTYKDELLHSPNKSQKVPDDEQENGNETSPHEDTTEIIPYQMSLNSCEIKRKMNESVWSVESLAPFIPVKEWSLQRNTFEPEIIIETTEEGENGGLSAENLNASYNKVRRLSRRFSFSDSVPASGSLLINSTPAEKVSPKRSGLQSEIDVLEMREPQPSQSVPLEKDPPVSPTALPSKIILSSPTEEGVDDNRSSEPEANQSPNQESIIVIEQQENGPSSPEQQCALLLESEAVEKVTSMGQPMLQNGLEDGACGVEVEDGTSVSKELSHLRKDQLCVPVADRKMAELSPSKAHLVDCGIQCTELQECVTCKQRACSREPNARHPFKNSDMKKANSMAEGYGMNGHGHKNQKRHGTFRNRGQGNAENQNSQQEPYHRYYDKPGKSKGGNGRNPRYKP